MSPGTVACLEGAFHATRPTQAGDWRKNHTAYGRAGGSPVSFAASSSIKSATRLVAGC
jgi:hypothetical protein